MRPRKLISMTPDPGGALPADEAERLAELAGLGILDSAPDEDYERLTRLAASVCGAPLAALNFVDADRQWSKARFGPMAAELPRGQSLCARTILEPRGVLEIGDLATLSGFDGAAYGPDCAPLRFYAGAAVRTGEGSGVGALCVLDNAPRRLNAMQREMLSELAAAAAAQLRARRELRIATQLDRLTGLPNWFHFESQFTEGKHARGIFSFVSLRTVSQINSAHGFRVADALIRQAAERLQTAVGANMLIGRVKRGLFIAFFPGMGADEFARKAAPALTAELFAPYNINQLTLVCPVNIGFASFPEHGGSLDEAVNAADAALQTAIEREQSVAFYDRSVDNRLSVYYRLEPQLRQALRQQQFVNYYQPKVDLASGKIVGLEALVRWIHPERGLVPPMDFVPALESTGLIVDAGEHILRRAVADWAAWRDAGLVPPRIAVNVAAAQLRRGDFVDALRAALAPIGGDTSAIGVEVTESVLISDMETAVAVLKQIRELGIPVSIDDFGTGYSSLAYIVTLPIDELKIDRAFVRKVTEDPAYRGIVSTCISLAHNLNLKVVAEGVETEGQVLTLQALQCDIGQGYYYSKPIPADQTAVLLENGVSPKTVPISP